MKKILWTGCMLLIGHAVFAQPFIVEGLAGNAYLFYQHLLAARFREHSRFGFMHVANVAGWYESDPKKGGKPHEFMNQAHLTLGLGKSFTIMTGMFYAGPTGVRASAGIQYALPFKDGLFILSPRVDIAHRGSMELMGMLEYQPMIHRSTRLYVRLQAMSNYGAYHHNRSYQRLRLGVDVKQMQVGVGLHFDEFGRESRVYVNTGIFVRKRII